MKKLLSILILLFMAGAAKQSYGQTSGTPTDNNCPPNSMWLYDCINKSKAGCALCGTAIATIDARLGIKTLNPQATVDVNGSMQRAFAGGSQ